MKLGDGGASTSRSHQNPHHPTIIVPIRISIRQYRIDGDKYSSFIKSAESSVRDTFGVEWARIEGETRIILADIQNLQKNVLKGQFAIILGWHGLELKENLGQTRSSFRNSLVRGLIHSNGEDCFTCPHKEPCSPTPSISTQKVNFENFEDNCQHLATAPALVLSVIYVRQSMPYIDPNVLRLQHRNSDGIKISRLDQTFKAPVKGPEHSGKGSEPAVPMSGNVWPECAGNWYFIFVTVGIWLKIGWCCVSGCNKLIILTVKRKVSAYLASDARLRWALMSGGRGLHPRAMFIYSAKKSQPHLPPQVLCRYQPRVLILILGRQLPLHAKAVVDVSHETTSGELRE
ncbi:hypothetical protein B0H17DRAFT_1127234 [Mycena rosella]|uniref:Uncharacterized protein n=1 Tax=Mycena rosella TaxID=1033263 RepID=A0AAD7GP09_MYCRO|nr:hypothetical protein B0H17DRAFT_1127234 [Mycena rosella]